MSINVTVSGNPVSINRGKMVTTDSYQSKKEFEKRRLMRIQQVRQQSKDIAEDVRNKVQREKKKQMGLIEKEGKEKHKNWQNRKLLELQTQYKEALNDIGVGYKDAESVIAQEQKEVAEKQGKIKEQDLAAKKRILKEKSERKSQEQIKKPKYVPNPVAKRRSPMKAPKIKKKKTPSASINISIPSNSSSDSKENVELIDVTSQPDEASSCTCEDKESESDVIMEKDTPSSESIKDFNVIDKEPQKLKSAAKMEDYYDSRISERIKRRDIMTNHPDYCEEFAKTDPVTLPESNTKIRNVIYNRNMTDMSEHVCSCDTFSFSKCNCCCRIAQGFLDGDSKYEKEGIPHKPKLKLKNSDEKVNVPKGSAGKLSQVSLDSNKVTYYDHNTRYEGRKSTSSLVKKILPDNFELQPNDGKEQEYFEKMRQKDREAIMRSNKVLEKEKIHKDYNEIMKKLPLLQKQERLARLNTDKPEYHMNEERLKQLEQKKQNQLENAFLRKIPILEPKIVTLPIRNNESNLNNENTHPFDSQPCNKETTKSDNVGEWNQDSSQKLFTAEEVQNIVKAFSEPTYQDRKSKFKELLHNLKLQKKQLIEEIKLLPKDQSVLEMLKDLDEFSKEDTQKQNRKKLRSEKRKKKNPRDELYTVSEESELELDKRPSRSKPKILIRQNISTQTTPVSKDRIIQVNDDDLSNEKNKLPEQNKKSTVRVDENVDDVASKPICKLQHIPCNCQPDKDETSDKLEIVIQFNENDQPQVVVKDKTPETSDKNKSDDTQKGQNQSEEMPHLRKKKSKSTNRSWKEQFSKNSSASTSYFSPPDLEERLKNGKFSHLYEKTQQSNISSTVPEPNLLNCIDKLLNMTRNNIDNLTVSSSSVTTPNQSVVEIETNIPPNPVNDVYKLMTKYLTEARKNLSFSQDEVNWSQASNPDTCCDVPLCPTNLKTKNQGHSDELKFKAAQDNTPNYVQYSYYDNYAKEYAAITDSTSRKIETLAAMIQKLREEKNKIIDISTASNKSDLNGQKEDFSTAYMELSGGSSNSYSLNEEEINKKLLHVDMDLANKLRKHPENPEPENTALFVPLLSDIPKLPKFQMCEETCGETRTKPPPSKGLSIAKKFNDISLIPHELSVIVESESQLSSKLDTSKNANASKGSVAFHSLPNESDIEKSVQIVCDNKTGGEKSLMQSSSSSDDLESLESMLRSIGMEWAIPTLHKTKEALALTASTSSDSSLKFQPGRKNNELDIVRLLKQHFINTISSSTLINTSTPISSILSEFSDVSAIRNSTGKDKSNRRTSTPLQRKNLSNTAESFKQAFSGESDLSTVKNLSDEKNLSYNKNMKSS